MPVGECQACGQVRQLDKCHIKSKGAGGGNQDWNIVLMHRGCHIDQHRLGWKRFSEKFPAIQRILEEKGWTFQELFGRVRLVRRDD